MTLLQLIARHEAAVAEAPLPINDITDRCATTPKGNAVRWMYAMLRGLEELADAERADVLELLAEELTRFAPATA